MLLVGCTSLALINGTKGGEMKYESTCGALVACRKISRYHLPRDSFGTEDGKVEGVLLSVFLQLLPLKRCILGLAFFMRFTPFEISTLASFSESCCKTRSVDLCQPSN